MCYLIEDDNVTDLYMCDRCKCEFSTLYHSMIEPGMELCAECAIEVGNRAILECTVSELKERYGVDLDSITLEELYQWFDDLTAMEVLELNGFK